MNHVWHQLDFPSVLHSHHETVTEMQFPACARLSNNMALGAVGYPTLEQTDQSCASDLTQHRVQCCAVQKHGSDCTTGVTTGMHLLP